MSDSVRPHRWQPTRLQWHPTPVLLPEKSHWRRSLVGCSLWGCKESDMTEHLHFHFSLSCTAEANGNPLQCSCLENPRDGGVWWAAIYGVTQSRTRLKWLSSSSSSIHSILPSHHWQAMLWLVTQSCPTVCDTMNCSPPGSSVYEDSPGNLMFSIENSRYSAISYMGNNLKRNEYM